MAIRGDDVLLVERVPEKHYAVLTVNREERGNSINFDLARRLAQEWPRLKADDEIWAVILTAVGDRFFCAGEDLKDRAELDEEYEGGFVQYVDDQGGWAKLAPVDTTSSSAIWWTFSGRPGEARSGCSEAVGA